MALRYDYGIGREEVFLELDDGETFHRDDVVRTFFDVDGSSAGYVQITSSAPLTITGRTSNETPVGGFGQALPVYTPEMKNNLVGGGVISGLRGGGAVRASIGGVNKRRGEWHWSVCLFEPC